MKTILCPTDFSTIAQNAVLYAAEFAKVSGAEIVIFHTEFFPEPVSKDEDYTTTNLPGEYIGELKERLKSLVIQLRMNFPEVKFTYVVEEGLVAENIALYANQHKVDLIIMGSSGASGIDAVFKGSNSVRVMECAKCPVLIIPETLEFKHPAVFAFASENLDKEESIIDEILDITRLFNAELQLLQIQTSDDRELVGSEISIDSIVNKSWSQKVRQKVVVPEDSIEIIEEYAKNQADILVMTCKRKNFLQKLFSQDKVEKIALDADLPLLILHRP